MLTNKSPSYWMHCRLLASYGPQWRSQLCSFHACAKCLWVMLCAQVLHVNMGKMVRVALLHRVARTTGTHSNQNSFQMWRKFIKKKSRAP
eukprot:910219-Pelagomonas_calceolata.AAC.1